MNILDQTITLNLDVAVGDIALTDEQIHFLADGVGYSKTFHEAASGAVWMAAAGDHSGAENMLSSYFQPKWRDVEHCRSAYLSAMAEKASS